MEDTLGFVDAATAVVDSHRRDGALRWRCAATKEAVHVGLGLEELRNARAQQRAVEVKERDIVNNRNGQESWRLRDIYLTEVTPGLELNPQDSSSRLKQVHTMELYLSKQEYEIIQLAVIAWELSSAISYTESKRSLLNRIMPSPQAKTPKGSTLEVSQELSTKEAMAQKSERNQTPTVNGLPTNLEKALEFLKAKDDTSRFVGLALLKPVLEQELSRQSGTEEEGTRAVIEQCWRAIPVKFLDRLLKAKPEGKRTKEEAGSMVGLAVAVLHAFMAILDGPEKDDRFLGRVPLLMSALRSTPSEATTQIMQVLATLATTREGSQVVFGARDKDEKMDQKPKSYIFVTVLLIDIRSTIPSLQEKLHSAEYPDISEHIARAYDIVSAFIGFLVQSLEGMGSDDEGEGSGPTFSAPMPVHLLMKLRANISEVMSLTIEHLRDRYDSSTAGAAGLHPSARTLNGGSTNPLPIAWDTTSGISKDPLTLSQLRALSLWLHEEENDALRREASGITDVFFALYQDIFDQDFRSPVLLSLEGIIEVPEGIEAFLREEGWAILAADLENLLSVPSEHARGIEVVRVLLAVVEDDVTGPTKEEWMSIVELARQSFIHAPETTSLELGVAICQLAVELLVRAPRSNRNRRRNVIAELRRCAEAQLAKVDGVSGGIRDGLDEVVQGLDSLSF